MHDLLCHYANAFEDEETVRRILENAVFKSHGVCNYAAGQRDRELLDGCHNDHKRLLFLCLWLMQGLVAVEKRLRLLLAAQMVESGLTMRRLRGPLQGPFDDRFPFDDRLCSEQMLLNEDRRVLFCLFVACRARFQVTGTKKRKR